MNEIASLISQVGFPIFIAIYLLMSNKTDVSALTTVISNNTEVLKEVRDKMTGCPNNKED